MFQQEGLMLIKYPCCFQTANEHTRKEYSQVGKAVKSQRDKQPGWAELYRPLKQVLKTFQINMHQQRASRDQ